MGRISRRSGGRALAVLGCVGATATVVALLASPVPASGASSAIVNGSWAMYGNNLAKTGFDASESVINPSDAASLKVLGTYSAGRHIFSQPVAGDGMVFFGSFNGNEYATTPTGTLMWSTAVGLKTLPASCDNQVPNPLGVTGTAEFVEMKISGVTTPVLFVPGGNSTLYALNASTGAILWQTAVGASKWDYMWDSPAFWDGSVYIGVSSPSNCPKTTQGQVFMLNATTGKVEHSFDVVPSGCVGGGVWGSISIDTTADELYVPTGSADYSSCPGTKPGNEPYAPALIELNATNLKLVGAWQVPLAQQIKDSDFGNAPLLFTAGDGTKMVAIANKNGVLYAFERGDLDAGPTWTMTISDDNKEPPLAPGGFDGTYLYEAAGPNTITTSSGTKTCKDGTMYKIDPTSAMSESTVWAECISGWPEGAASLAPGLIVIGLGTHIEMYSTKTGAILFTYTDKASNSRFDGSGSFSYGKLFFGNQDGNLYAIGT